jgi:BON domain
MINKSIIKLTLAMFFLVVLFNIGASAQKTDCSKTTEAEIVAAIYAKIDTKYQEQTDHINVRIADGVVTLEGWVTTKTARKDVEKFAKKTACVKKVVNNLKLKAGGGCGEGEKQCGSTCIGATEKCNVRSGQ